MPSLFFRYIFRQTIIGVFLIISTLSGIVWIALALRQLDVVTNQGQDAVTLLAMTTLALPNLMAIIAPFALLIAVIHTLSRLSGDSELIIITASGGSIWVVARPLIFLASIITSLLIFTNHFCMPWSMRMLREYVLKVRTDLLGQALQPGRFSSPERGLTFHIRERSPNGDILGLLLHDTRKEQQVTSYLAEKGIIIKQDNSAFLIMTDGHVITKEDQNSPQRIVSFEKYVFDLDSLDKKTNNDSELNPRERYYSELVNPEPNSYILKTKPGQFTAELHERISNPLYPIAFVMIAIASIGATRSTRQKGNVNLVLGLIGAASVKVSSLALNNIIVIKPYMFPLLYALPLLTIIISALLLLQNQSQKRIASLFVVSDFLDRYLFSNLKNIYLGLKTR